MGNYWYSFVHIHGSGTGFQPLQTYMLMHLFVLDPFHQRLIDLPSTIGFQRLIDLPIDFFFHK
jgi:hypothetical protein